MLLDEYNEAEAMELFKEDGREEGLEQGREEGLEQGRKEGLEQGREESARMYKCLKEAGRLDDYDKAMEDPDFYKQLKEEFKIS